MTDLVLGGLLGYLLGSVSFARIVASRVLPGEDISRTVHDVGGQGFETEVHGVSPSAVGSRAGPRAGGLATLGDILKATVATGLAWLVLDRDAAAAAGVGAVLGHVAPLYHRFRGGFGQSPIIGATLVLSPLGLPAAIVASNVVTLVAAEMTWGSLLWPLFLVAWGLVFSDTPFTWFAVLANVLYLWRLAPQLAQRVRFRQEHHLSRRERLAEVRTAFRAPMFRPDHADPAGGADEEPDRRR